MEIDLNQNRAFRYGDAIFETIIFKNGDLQFWKYHLERLQEGCKILKFKADDLFKDDYLKTIILDKIVSKSKSYRIRLHVWRKDGGLYAPITHEIEINIAINPFSEITPAEPTKVDFAKSIFLNYSPISALKTTNSLPYILANIEKTERKLDDLIILDSDGNIAEGCSSNIFWKKDNIFFTPSLECGCINGVRRRFIIEYLKKNKIECQEGKFKPEVLFNADSIFLTNVASIRFINFVSNIKISNIKNNLIINILK